MAIQYIDVKGIFSTGRFRHAVRATGRSTVYLSGQVPLDEGGNYVGVGDFDAQVRQVYSNLDTILKSLGVGWEAVAIMHIYIVNYSPERYARLRQIRGEFLGDILPASTVVGVTALAFPQFEVEVELTVDLD